MKNKKKEIKSINKVFKGATRESMIVNVAPLKYISKEKEKKIKKHQDESEKCRLAIKERQEKVYPFPDTNITDMLEQLLKK